MPVSDHHLPATAPSLWAVLGLAAVFAGLGGLFITAPALGAAIFGIPAPGGLGDAYLRAIGLRDAALALYLAGLAWAATRRAVCLVLGASTVIPFGDIALVLAAGTAAWWQIALHGLSAAVLIGVMGWVGFGQNAAVRWPHRRPSP